jgi:hypothetical protein
MQLSSVKADEHYKLPRVGAHALFDLLNVRP